MNKKSIFTILPASAAVLLSLPTLAPLLADDIDVIEVTATRTPLSVVDIASSVTVISAEDIAKRQTFSLPDLLNTLPGIAVARAGSVGGQAQLRLRGGEANQTLVLIDGVQINDPAAGDEVQFELLSTTEIERVEIVRGPLSSVWGSDAVSGVINIITKKGEGDLSVRANGEAGAFGTYRFGGSIGGASEKGNFRIGASYSDSDGTNVSRSGDENDGFRAVTVNATGGYKPSATSNLSFSLRHTDARNEFDSTDFTTGFPADSDRVTNTTKTSVSVGGEFQLFDGRLNQSARVTYLDTEIANLSDGAASGSTLSERWGFYADSRIKLADGHNLTLALDHEDTDFSQRGTVSFFGDPNQDQNSSITGYVADYVGNFGDAVTLTGSVRRDDNDRFENATSWRGGIVYKFVGTGTRLYGNVARGQKAPTFIELFGFFSDSFVGNPNLTPERSIEYEFGVSHVALDGKLSLDASYFTARLENEINGFAFDPVTFQFTAENRDGKSTREGFELTADFAVSDQLNLTLSYAYLDAEEPDGNGGLTRELRRPKNNASLFVDYRPSDRVGLTLDANYVGSSIDTFFPPFPEPSEAVTLGGYLLVNIGGTYQINDAVSLYGRVENLLDEAYENLFGFNTPGIGAYAGFRASF